MLNNVVVGRLSGAPSLSSRLPAPHSFAAASAAMYASRVFFCMSLSMFMNPLVRLGVRLWPRPRTVSYTHLTLPTICSV